MANIKITKSIKAQIFAALIAAGVAAPSAYVAIELTVPSEGFRTDLHLDPVGKATTGVGHLVQKGETPKKVYTEQEVIDQFVKDWVVHEQYLDKAVKVKYRSPWQKGALTDFTFNKGPTNLQSSTLLKDLNAGRHDAACLQLTKWVFGTVNGKKVKLPGLEIRASKQFKYCMGDEPSEYKSFYMHYGGVHAK